MGVSAEAGPVNVHSRGSLHSNVRLYYEVAGAEQKVVLRASLMGFREQRSHVSAIVALQFSPQLPYFQVLSEFVNLDV